MNVVVSTVGIIIYIFTTLLNFYFLVYINVTFLFFLLIPSAHYHSIYWKVQTTDHTDRSKHVAVFKSCVTLLDEDNLLPKMQNY